MPDQINKLGKPIFSELPVDFQSHYSQLVDTVNSLAGHNGKIPLANHLDLSGSRVMNVGSPQTPTDALSSGIAEGKYSANVIGPKLESSGSNPLRSVRRIGDPSQRENSSSYMNDLMSSVPSANQLFPVIANVGGQVQVMIPASPFTFADGSNIQLIARTDLLSKPAQFAISTISASGNVVTVVTTAATGLVAGQAATITGVTPAAFNGTFGLTSVSGTTLTYQLDLGTTTGSGGYVQTNSVYYYSVQKRDPTIHLLGPYPSDTMQNRLQANFDGNQVVAVVVVTNNGGQVSQSGGGGSPIVGSPTAGSFF